MLASASLSRFARGYLTANPIGSFLIQESQLDPVISGAIFFPYSTGLAHGSRQTSFLQMDRLGFIQRRLDAKHFQADLHNRDGHRYCCGWEGYQPSPKLAAVFLKQSSLHGNVNAQFALGVMAFTGHGQTGNGRHGMELLKAAANRGHPRALYCYGLSLMSGQGVPKNRAKSVRKIRMAAEAGYDEAMYAYARMLFDGYATHTNEREAFRLFERAAAKGNVRAKFWQAVCYQDGRGVKHDSAKAKELLTQAEESGLIEAKAALAILAAAREGKQIASPPRRRPDDDPAMPSVSNYAFAGTPF
jgi:TPR repeat protein